MRGANQKLKLLYLKQFFEEKTDEQHPATMEDIRKYLTQHEVDAERKSIGTDMDALEQFGMPVRDKDMLRNKKYFLQERTFKPSEVKMILDSVASSKFLTEKKSLELMKKLGTLVNEHHRHELNRQVKVAGRVKSMNENTTEVLDHIHAAMAANTTVRFKYFHYNMNKEREFTRDGKYYEVSPWALIFDNSYYYLLAVVDDDIRTFRADRMAATHAGTKKRQGKELFEAFDLGKFTKSTFGMFTGKEEKVEMVFHNSLIDTVIDKFGKEVFLSPVDNYHFKITVPVAVNPQFFEWLFGLGGKATIVGPKAVVKKMKDMLENVKEKYN